MIHIAPLGTGVILPAVVVGYELPLPRGDPDRVPGLPGWVLTVDQQAGGLCMTYPSVVGAVLRLDANRDRGLRDLAHLIHGLRCMAEDPDVGTLRREYPTLARLVLTHGGEYAPADLRDLEGVLAGHLRLPPVRGGVEAFVRHDRCDPLDYFRNWAVLRCAVRTDGPVRGSVYDFPGKDAYHCEQGNLTDLEMTDDLLYDADRQSELVRLGAELGRPEPPDVFFLWENSD